MGYTLVGEELPQNIFLQRSVSEKMNTQQIQFNRPWVAALLLAGLILALAAGLAWVGADARGSTFQPAKMGQECAYSPQPGQTGLSAEVDCPGADLGKDEDGLRPWSPLKSVKGGRGGISGEVNK
jgi:hypothetical protein